MRKFYFTIITLVALLCVTVSASATPFKAVYLELTVNETGRGKVYMKTEDPDNPQHGRARTLFLNVFSARTATTRCVITLIRRTLRSSLTLIPERRLTLT